MFCLFVVFQSLCATPLSCRSNLDTLCTLQQHTNGVYVFVFLLLLSSTVLHWTRSHKSSIYIKIRIHLTLFVEVFRLPHCAIFLSLSHYFIRFPRSCSLRLAPFRRDCTSKYPKHSLHHDDGTWLLSFALAHKRNTKKRNNNYAQLEIHVVGCCW